MASAAPGSAAIAAAAASVAADVVNAAASASASASTAESCGCTNIAIMQLFHELKQQFPAVPDRVVSECISQNFHDKEACEAILRRENQGYLLHSYPSCLKMSSTGSCEPDTPLAARLNALSVCSGERCPTKGHPPVPDDVEGPSCTAVAAPRQPGFARVLFLNQGSTSASSSSSSLFSEGMKGREVMYEFSDAQTTCQTSSVRRSENRWSSTHVSNSSSNSSTVESIDSETAKFFHSASGGGGGVTSGAPRVGFLGLNSSQTFSSQKETVSMARGVGMSRAASESVSTVYASKPCARPTTLNVSNALSGPARTLSAPAAPSATAAAAAAAAQFDPFHPAHEQHPASTGDRYTAAGDAGVPYTGSYNQHGHNFGSGANFHMGGVGSAHHQQNASRENVTTSVYSDRTMVNSYQVNVNCSMRGGGSSSVNVTGSSSHTVVSTPETPAASVTTVSAPRPAPPPRPPPPQPKPKPRARSSVNVDPAPYYTHQSQWGVPGVMGGGGSGAGVVAATPPQQPRSYTSVNLTLRPPSSEPQPPIDIQSAGTSLMYSTSSYDPRQGFQSKLQICIGPGGVGSVSAMRTRTQEPLPWGAAPPPSATFVPAHSPLPAPADASTGPVRAPPPLPKQPPAAGSLLTTPHFPAPAPVVLPPTMSTLSESTLGSITSSHSDDVQRELLSIRTEHLQSSTRALLEQQLERKTRLQRELRQEKEKLRAMQRDVRGMETDLAQRQLSKRSPAAALPQLSTLQKVQRLRQEIHLLTEECKKMTIEVDMSSDSRIPLGETDEEFYKNIYTGQQGSVTAQSPRDIPHHYALPRQNSRVPPPQPPPPEADREGQSWTCTECTFRNYWELEYCEQCEMPKLMLGIGPRPAPGAFCYCHPNPGKPLTPSVAAYPVYVPTPKMN